MSKELEKTIEDQKKVIVDLMNNIEDVHHKLFKIHALSIAIDTELETPTKNQYSNVPDRLNDLITRQVEQCIDITMEIL